MALDLFKRVESRKGLFAVEKITLIYNLLTSILILFMFQRMDHPLHMLWDRAVIAAMTFLLMYLYRLAPCKFSAFVRIAIQMSLLSGYFRVQPRLPQSGSFICYGRAVDVRRTACRMVLSCISADVGERAVQHGLFRLLSYDSGCDVVLFHLSVRPV